MLAKKKEREYLYQTLFAMDFFDHEKKEPLIAFLMRMGKINKTAASAIIDKTFDVRKMLIEIDPLIEESMISYSSKHISKIELNVIRLAVFEMMFDDDVPAKVAIAEAIRIVRKFGSKEGGLFVNAVLDAIYQLQIANQHAC